MYWSFWLGGLALAGVATLHWLWVGRLMSVSSRLTALVEHTRRTDATPAAGEPVSVHLVFLGGLALGGLVAALVNDRFAVTALELGPSFARLFGSSPLVTAAVVTVGGVLVGFGTRLARGCTSGHGLSGVARLERGSVVATIAFFGTGTLVSLALASLLGGAS